MPYTHTIWGDLKTQLAARLDDTGLLILAPCSSDDDASDSLQGYTIRKAEASTRTPSLVCFAYFTHLLQRKFGLAVLLSRWNSIRVKFATIPAARSSSTLLLHVGRIISICAQEKMGRVAAWPIIAVVQHVVLFWILACVDKVSNAVCTKPSQRQSKLAVAILISGLIPRPAFGWFSNGNLGKESLDVVQVQFGNAYVHTFGMVT